MNIIKFLIMTQVTDTHTTTAMNLCDVSLAGFVKPVLFLSFIYYAEISFIHKLNALKY